MPTTNTTRHRGAHAKPRRSEGVNAIRGVLIGLAVSLGIWGALGTLWLLLIH